MLMKEAVRKCVCKECGKELTMFIDGKGKLICFPANTVRPVYGFYELADHLRNYHKELYGLLLFSDERKSAIMDEYSISELRETA